MMALGLAWWILLGPFRVGGAGAPVERSVRISERDRRPAGATNGPLGVHSAVVGSYVDVYLSAGKGGEGMLPGKRRVVLPAQNLPILRREGPNVG